MKLSKVKKVCLDVGDIIVKKADTGIDISTWIGTNSAQYPVRGMAMSTELAVRIWEIEGKKLKDIQVLEDTEDDEAPTLIRRDDLKSINFLVDPFTAEDEEEYPGLRKIATIDGYILLEDRETGKGWMFRESKLGPVEGNRLLYLQVENNRGLIAVYGDGMLEAVIYAAPWYASEYTKAIMQRIAEVYMRGGQQK